MLKQLQKITKLNTRQRVYAGVTILFLVFVVLQRVEITSLLKISSLQFDFIEPMFLGVLTFFLMYWICEFRITGERFITILSFPAIGVFVFTLFVELIITTIFGQLGVLTFILISGIFFAFFNYLLILTANIVNVAYLEDIPLGQAGRASYYVMNLIIAYLLFLIIISNDVNLVLKMGLIFIVPYLLVMSTLWTIRLGVGQRMLVAFGIAFVITFAFFVLAIWPLSSIYIAFILSIILYISLGVALEIREVISNQIWIEYTALFLLIFLILMVLSEWGINGTLI